MRSVRGMQLQVQLTGYKYATWRHVGLSGDVLIRFSTVVHGESITDQASPRTPTQRTFQPQEAVQPTPNHTPSRHSCAKGKLPLQPFSTVWLLPFTLL